MNPSLPQRPFYDAHNHLQDAWLAPHLGRVLADLAALPLGGAVVNGTCEADWDDVIALARDHPEIIPSIGLHPWDVGNAGPRWQDGFLRRLEAHPRLAVGEIGLDRWILTRARPDDPRLAGLKRAPLEQQVVAFTWQLERAAERNLPVSIHCLDAWGALMETLKATARPACGFLLHAFSGSTEMAREFAALGASFSFNGSFLGPRQAARRAVFEQLPLDGILAETDAPAMPVPPERSTHALPGSGNEGPINHPANIGAVYAGLASLRKIPAAELARQIEQNFLRLFGRLVSRHG